MAGGSYNPAQQAVISLLGRGNDAVSFPASLGQELRAELEHALAPLAAHLDPGDPLWVSKHALAAIHDCEAHHLAAGSQPFAWTVASVRGTVAHKAIELGVHWPGMANPADLVDEALARLAEQGRHGPQVFLAGLQAGDRAELRGMAVDLVAGFQECFPPPRAAWIPVTESRVRVELRGGAVILSGKTDLTLGRPRGLVAGKVIIDLKSGGPAMTHREDLRFYALLESIKLGVPPRKLASYYLDTGRAQPEDVTVPLLWSTVRRVSDGIAKIVAVTRAGRPPTRLAGSSCRWCPMRATCPEGRAELGGLDGQEAA